MAKQCLKEYSVHVIILGHKLAGSRGARDASPPLLSLQLPPETTFSFLFISDPLVFFLL